MSAPRLVVAGWSQEPVCGVRDHAVVLSTALERAGAHVSTVWAQGGTGRSPGLARWASEVGQRCVEDRAEAILLHYSVFAFSRHGIPADVPLLAARLSRHGIPIVLFAHEYAYQWGQRGWRGAVHAATHRAALVPLLAVCSAAVVTTPARVQWMRTRWWLPRRPIGFAPVFSNIRPEASTGTNEPLEGRIGVFSFGGKGLAVELVTEAVADVAKKVPSAHLVLIGAPGEATPAGEQWRRAALASGCAVVFTGVADEAVISRELAACAVVVHPDPGGPSSRKTSLAASLAHGRAVVALEGPHTWGDLVDTGALTVVEPDLRSLAFELHRLLLDPVARAAAGSDARGFYESRLAPGRTVDAVLEAISASTPSGGYRNLWRMKRSSATVDSMPRAFSTGTCRPMSDAAALLATGAALGARTSAGAATDFRPRVTLVAQEIHDQGGMERACAELIRHTHEQVRYTVVAIELDRNLEPLVERWIRVRVPPLPYPLKFLMFFGLAGFVLRRDRGDLIHTVGAIVPNRVDIATVHFCHAGFLAANGRLASASATPMRRLNTSLARRLAIAAERRSYRPGRIRAIAAVSQGVVKEVSTHYPEVPVHLTPNGVDLKRFRPDASERLRVRTEEGVGQDTCVALFVGGDWSHKGLGLAVEGVAKARASGADVVLWVVGSGDVLRLRRLARRVGCEETVTHFGRRNDTARFYRGADVFVLPSAYETFSIVCFEAAACGLPLVIPPLSGAGEVVGEDEAGIIIERDCVSVGSALLALAADPERRIRLGQEAQRRVRDYTWGASTAAVAKIYRDLAGEVQEPR